MKSSANYYELSDAVWRKSSVSNPNGECVEIAERQGSMIINGRVYVRDSKNPSGAILEFTEAEWNAFIAGAKKGEFDPR
ncbi:MAG TPA: DUF397 domain-containing protein [Candidatus Saccharimonadales bacterium]|nr:DUF397 domain-containing protein [Candidatus Saccharimonadales bacterium]